MVRGEAGFDKGKTFCSYIGFHVLAEGGVKPCHIYSSVVVFFLLFFVASGSNLSLYLYPLFCRASLNMGAAFSNSSSLHDVEDNLLLIAEGRFFIMFGG